MSDLAIIILAGLVPAAGLAYLLCLAARFRTRWFHYPLALAVLFAVQRGFEYLLGPGYATEGAGAAAGGLILGVLLAWPCARGPLEENTGGTSTPAKASRFLGLDLEPLGQAWFAEALVAPRLRRLWFAFHAILLMALGTFIQALAAMPSILNLPLALALLALGLGAMAWDLRTARCPGCGLNLVSHARFKQPSPMEWLISLRECPRCGYRRGAKRAPAQPAAPPPEIAIAYTGNRESHRWAMHALWCFDPFYRGTMIFALATPVAMISMSLAMGDSGWAMPLAGFVAAVFLFHFIRAREPRVTLAFGGDGLHGRIESGGESGKPPLPWTAATKAIAYQGGLLILAGRLGSVAIPPCALDEEKRAALERFLTAKGIAVSRHDEGDSGTNGASHG